MTASASECLRPILSAIQPNTSPPNGRATNPTANTASVFRKADWGLSVENRAAARYTEKVA